MKKWLVTCDRCGKEIHVAGEEQGYTTPSHVDTFSPYIKDKKWGQNFKSYELCQECFADVVEYIVKKQNHHISLSPSDTAVILKGYCTAQESCEACAFHTKRCELYYKHPDEWEVPDGEKREG